jgi:hypothetical protein
VNVGPVSVFLDSLGVSREMTLTPTSPGHVNVTITNVAAAEGATAEVEATLTPRALSVDLNLTVTPTGDPVYAIGLSFGVSGIPAGTYTFSDGVQRKEVTVE